MMTLVGQAASTGSEERMTLPWSDVFSGTTIEAGWMVDASPGNRLTLRGGAVEITANTNTYAHLERPLGRDHVTASARLKPAPAISWTTSLFLYWDPGNWCQMGVISREGGRFYVTQMVAGRYDEYDLARCAFDEWHWVRIELGEDCIRYLSSEDGRTWTEQHGAERPAEFAGPPALLIVGKGYSRGVDPYAAPDLDNNYSEPGGPGVSWIDEVRVEETPAARRQAAPQERAAWTAADRDALGERELARPGEPSFETVARYLPPLKHPREVVGVPAHPHDVGVREDGRLEFTDNLSDPNAHVALFQVGDPPVPFAGDQTHTTRRLLDGWRPVVVITFPHEGLEYEQTVLGYADGFRAEADLWAFVRFTVRNPGATARQTAVRVAWQTGKPEPQAWPLEVPAGGAATICWRFPYAPGDGPAVEDVEASEFEARLAEVRTFWKEWLARGLDLEVPEPRVANAWKAWLAFASLDVDRINGRDEAHDGAGFYEAIFGYSAALHAHALDLWGRSQEAERVLEAMLSFQNEDGLYMQNYGLPDQGALIFALAEHYRLTRDEAWLRRVAPNLIAAADWIVRQREAAKRERPDREAVTYGLLRFRPYCDYAEPVFNYYGEAYSCRGLEEAAAVLNRLDHETTRPRDHSPQTSRPPDSHAAAQRFREAAADYRRDLLTSMDRAVIERRGHKILPLEPDTHRLLRSSNYRASSYYGLVASMLLESGFLPPEDQRAFLLTDFLEQRRGLILGLSEFAGGVDPAYTYGYLMTQLQRDEIERVLLGFYAMLAYGMSRETYSGVECTQIKTGENALTLPHLYSCTQQLRLLRMLLLREEGDILLLAQALPRCWLAQGQRVALRRAPTQFGPLSFSLASRVEDGEITAHVTPPPDHPQIKLRLRHPARLSPVAVTVNGQRWTRFDGDVIDLGRPTRAVTVRARYEVGPRGN